MEAANLPTFLKFKNAQKSDICVIFAKSHGWPWNWRGPAAKLMACAPPPRLRPKTTTSHVCKSSISNVSFSVFHVDKTLDANITVKIIKNSALVYVNPKNYVTKFSKLCNKWPYKNKDTPKWKSNTTTKAECHSLCGTVRQLLADNNVHRILNTRLSVLTSAEHVQLTWVTITNFTSHY